MKFFGDGAATDDFAALKHEGLESALGKIKRGDECIVAAADKNYALSDRHVQFFSVAERDGGTRRDSGRGRGRRWMNAARPIFSTL